MSADDDENDWINARAGDVAVDSHQLEPMVASKKEGPPEQFREGSWYDRARADWWWDGRPDPCPVRPVGKGSDGYFFFISPQGELRRFSSSNLHRAGGLADLFDARLWWAKKHFPGTDRDGKPTKRHNVNLACEGLMRACVDSGFISGEVVHRQIGVWRGPDGNPVVHAGDALIMDGRLVAPGVRLGSSLYTIAEKCERPALEKVEGGGFRYAQTPASLGQAYVGSLLNWNFTHSGGAELLAGYQAAASLGDATDWRSHLLLRARPGSGKSTLMRCVRAGLGGASHEVLTSYTAPYVEQGFKNQACAILLDEMEKDSEQNRMQKLTELIRLLSDHGGAKGGRGSAAGEARSVNVRGAVCMAATARGQWRQQDRERITVVELDKLEGGGRTLPTHEEIDAVIKRAADWSPALRSRMLANWNLFQENLRRARARIAELGGTARDGNQLGHLLAGWWTLTSDDAATEAMLDDVTRFTRWIISLTDAEDGLDPATQCWNRLLSADARLWRAGDSLTVGQVIARAREIDNGQSSRNALAAMGLRLLAVNPHDKSPSWPEADMGIANNHAGLEEIFRGTEWGGGRWADTFSDLEFREVDGTMTRPTHIGPVRYAGAQSRGVLIPARFLPSIKDEQP